MFLDMCSTMMRLRRAGGMDTAMEATMEGTVAIAADTAHTAVTDLTADMEHMHAVLRERRDLRINTDVS